MKHIITAIFVLTASSAFAEGDVEKGEKAFRKCASCHSIDEGGKTKNGPALWDIMNRGVATSEDFKYSKQLLAFANDNPMWTPELMDAWLADTQKLVKGSKMRLKVKKEKDRENLIAYLQSMGVE